MSRGALRTPAGADPGAAPASTSRKRADAGRGAWRLSADIQTLIGHAASIDGEAGVGYMLRPGFVLPPLMFSDEEIEALEASILPLLDQRELTRGKRNWG